MLLRVGIFVVALITTSLGSSFAKAGANGGGGGAEIEAAFKLRGYVLISKIAANPTANGFCSAQIMKGGLDSADVKVVPQLVNPLTQKQILDSKLDAWTIPGYVQLLDKSNDPSKQVWRKLLKDTLELADQNALNALIIHEIYRSTGTCNDNKMKITVQVSPLLNSTPVVARYSESFTFTAPYYGYDQKFDFAGQCVSDRFIGSGYFYEARKIPVLTSHNPQTYYPSTGLSCRCNAVDAVVCGQSPNSQGAEITCMDFERGVIFKKLKVTGLNETPAVPNGRLSVTAPAADLTVDFTSATQERENCPSRIDQLPFVSADHPLIVVHDIEQGTWTCSLQ